TDISRATRSEAVQGEVFVSDIRTRRDGAWLILGNAVKHDGGRTENEACCSTGPPVRLAQVRQISAAFRAPGPSFAQRGPVGDAFAALPMQVLVDATEQKVVFEPFVALGQKGIYRPLRTVVESADGHLVEALDNPRDTLRSVALGDPWSAPQVLYFIGYS